MATTEMETYLDELTLQFRVGNGKGKIYTWSQASRDLEKKGVFLPIVIPKGGILDRAKESCSKIKKKKTKNHIFTPSNFSQYIGQEKAKSVLESYINATKQRRTVFPHLLIHGKAGMGKTTLANLVAAKMEKSIKNVIGASVTDDISKQITELNGNMLFIDEIHALQRDFAETIYNPMENFIDIEGNDILPFTLIGATTEIGELLEDRRPLYDRFKIIIELEDYTYSDLEKISRQYKKNLFSKDIIDDKMFRVIAENSRNTPRTTIRLTEALVYFNGDIRTVLKNFGIIKNGYTVKDKKLLEYLSKNKVVGLQGIAAFLDTSVKNYLYEIEPYLIKNEIIIRTPRGRAISNCGRGLLKSLS